MVSNKKGKIGSKKRAFVLNMLLFGLAMIEKTQCAIIDAANTVTEITLFQLSTPLLGQNFSPQSRLIRLPAPKTFIFSVTAFPGAVLGGAVSWDQVLFPKASVCFGKKITKKIFISAVIEQKTLRNGHLGVKLGLSFSYHRKQKKLVENRKNTLSSRLKIILMRSKNQLNNQPFFWRTTPREAEAAHRYGKKKMEYNIKMGKRRFDFKELQKKRAQTLAERDDEIQVLDDQLDYESERALWFLDQLDSIKTALDRSDFESAFNEIPNEFPSLGSIIPNVKPITPSKQPLAEPDRVN